jgi:NADH-quinone oxidoreductase subunit E
LNGCDNLLEYLEKKLQIREGETTKDGKFTLETVECLGACEIAPMMQVNGEPQGPLTPEKIDEILENLKS